MQRIPSALRRDPGGIHSNSDTRNRGTVAGLAAGSWISRHEPKSPTNLNSQSSRTSTHCPRFMLLSFRCPLGGAPRFLPRLPAPLVCPHSLPQTSRFLLLPPGPPHNSPFPPLGGRPSHRGTKSRQWAPNRAADGKGGDLARNWTLMPLPWHADKGESSSARPARNGGAREGGWTRNATTVALCLANELRTARPAAREVRLRGTGP